MKNEYLKRFNIMAGIYETLKKWAGLNGSGATKASEMKELEDALLDFADKYGQAGKWHSLTAKPVTGPVDGKVREVTTAVIGRLPSDSGLTAFVGTDSLKSMITANRSLYSNLEKDHWDMFRVDSLNPSDKKTILGLIAEAIATNRFVSEDPGKRELAYEALAKSAKFGSPMDDGSYKALHDYLASYGEIGMVEVTADRLWNTSYLDFKDEKHVDAARKELVGIVSDIQEDLEDLKHDRAELIKAFKERLSDPKALSFTGAHADALFNFRMSCENLGHTEEESQKMVSKVLKDVIAAGGYPEDRADTVRKELSDYLDYQRKSHEFGQSKAFANQQKQDNVPDSYKGISDKDLLAMVDRKVRNMEKIEPLTRKQADIIHESGIWKKWSQQQLVVFQAFQPHMAVGFDEHHEAASKVLGRTVGYAEIASKGFREEVARKFGLSGSNVSTNAGKQIGKGWAGFLNSASGEKTAIVASGKEQVPVAQQAPQADAEKTLHDNFEKLMKESEKQDQANHLKR